MRRLAGGVVLSALLIVPAGAQDDGDDDGGGFLERTLEDALSGAGRDVSIRGFAGALSSTATMDEMTISDAEGVWLTLRGAELNWSRAQLLRGRVQVELLRAEEIIVSRAPVAEDSGPSAAASGFQLPDLPVSVNVGEISAERLEIGEPVFGYGLELSLEGALQLADGAGEGSFEARRLDGTLGLFDIGGAFDNATEVLSLSIDVSEAPGGLIATLAGIPGAPSVDLDLTGDGPLSDFSAELVLATDGEPRLEGALSIEGTEDSRFRADVSGDVSPLFLPEYRRFFGPDVALSVVGQRAADGVLTLSELDLQAAQLAFGGEVVIGADGLPRLLDLEGRIASEDGTPVVLPGSGTPTEIAGADLDVTFDATEGDRWTADIVVTDLVQGDISARSIALDASGRIATGVVPEVTADVDIVADALDLGDPDVQAALGEVVEAAARIAWVSGNPVEMTDLTVAGASYGLQGSAVLELVDGGFDLITNATLRATDLAVFSGLAGRPLTGSVEARVSAEVSPIAGLLDVTLDGRGRNLTVGLAEVDPLLAGDAIVGVTLRRTEAGTFLDRLSTRTDVAEIEARGRVTPEGGGGSAEVVLNDAGLLAPGLTGGLAMEATADGLGDVWNITAVIDGEALALSADVEADLTGEVPRAEGRVSLRADRLAPFSARIGREIGGAVDLTAEGFATADLASFDLALRGTSRDLKTGVTEADALLAGSAEYDLAAARSGGAIAVERVEARSDAVAVDGSGRLDADMRGALEAVVRLARPGLIAPGLPGPLTVEARAEGGPNLWDVEADVDGAGTEAAARLRVNLAEDTPRAEGWVSADLTDLAPFSELAGRRLGGALSGRVEGQGAVDFSTFDLSLSAQGQDLRTGIAQADQLLRGRLTLEAGARRGGDVIRVRSLRMDTPQIAVEAQGSVGDARNAATFDVRLANLGLFLPELQGPVTAAGRASQQNGQDWRINVDVDGPGGIGARVTGGAAPDFAALDLRAQGEAPLSAADPFIAPRAIDGIARFDLAVSGPPALNSVSGTVRTQGTRFVAPALGVVLTGLQAEVGLSRGSANLNMGADVQGGGRVGVDGGLALQAPFPADLTVTLDRAAAIDPGLYETSIDGTIRISGGLTGGALIAGQLQLNETEVQIPSTGISGAGTIPDLRHVNEPAAVRATRQRAGLIQEADAASGGGRAFPLDLVINAPNQIFIRGRGLEAELGGTIRIGGTTADVIPSGQFELVRGRLDILGKRLTLDEGRATLQGDFDPVVRLVAGTEAADTNISIVVEGEVSSPEITFLSEPDLPQDEVVARLLFGRGIDNLSPLQAARLASAVATLAGRGGGLLSSIRQGFGLDDLDVTTDDEGDVGVRAGAYISDNVYTDVTVDSQGSAEVSINLDLSPSVTVKSTVGSEGQTGIGVFFERDY